MKNLEKEELALIFFSFLAAVLSIRTYMFFWAEKHLPNPEIAIWGIHIPHYIVGIFLILTAGVLFFGARRKNFYQLTLFGVGFGFLFDEFSFWFNFRANDYWVPENFFAIFILGMIFFWLFAKNEKKYEYSIGKRHSNYKDPLISIVIPAFNEGEFLTQALQSAAGQDFEKFEIIVVDNNSGDNTAIIAQRFGARVVFEPRQGIGAARQRGFSEAKGKFIATTDADTILPKDWLLRIVKKFESDRELVAYGGLYNLYSGPTIARIAVYYFHYPLWILERLVCGGWSLPGANFAVRKDAFWKAGGFDVRLHRGEDADLTLKLSRIGRVVLDPSFKVRTSGRRFRHGLIPGMINYAPNVLIRIFLKQHKFLNISPIRTEDSLLTKLSLLCLAFPAIFLSSLFYFSNPSIAQVKEIRIFEKKLSSTTEIIKEKKDEFKDSLSKSRIGTRLKKHAG